jgi:uncharacterized membrane protein
MNLHPIFVHFPIGLLTLYVLLELIRIKRITGKPYWMNTKAILAVFGFLGAVAAYITGPEVEGGAPRILEMHESFATATLLIFGILALHYVLRWARHEGIHHRIPMLPDWIVIMLAIFGLVAITITGGLGGAMVYGTNFDPFMAPVFRMLGI